MSNQAQRKQTGAQKSTKSQARRKGAAANPGTLRSGPTFAEYLRQAKLGDMEAFGTLYVEAFPILRAMLRRCPETSPLFRRRGQDVNDVLNSAFLKVLGALEGYDCERGAFAWMLRITINTGIDHLRRQNHQPLTGNDLTDLKVSLPQLVEEAEAEAAERHAGVDAVRPELSEREQWAYQARFVEGKKYRIIARELGVPVNTVATIIRRLRLKIRSAVNAL